MLSPQLLRLSRNKVHIKVISHIKYLIIELFEVILLFQKKQACLELKKSIHIFLNTFLRSF